MVAKSPLNCKRPYQWPIHSSSRAVVRYFHANLTIPVLSPMLKHTIRRRALGSVLIALGALMMWLAPEVWAGLVMILIAVALEILGITMERRDR